MNLQKTINKYHLDKKTWTHKGAHAVLHFFFPVSEPPFKPLKEYYGDCCEIIVFFIHDNYAEWYWNDEDMVRLRGSSLKKVHQNQEFLDKLLRDWHGRINTFNEVMQKIDSINLSKLSDKELLKLYYEWYNMYVNEYSLAIILQDAFSMYSEDFLMPHFKEIIQKKGFGPKFNDYYALLTSPVNESFVTQEFRDRLLIAQKVKNLEDLNKLEIIREIDNHSKKYFWIRNNYAKDIYLDSDDFKELIKTILKLNFKEELSKIDNEIVEVKKNKGELIKKLNLEQESKNLIKITEIFAYMQDERKKYVMMSTHYQTLFIDEFGKRLNLDRELMKYTYIHELKDLISQKKLNKDIFEERKKAVLCLHTFDGYEIISGKLAKEIHDKIFVKKEEKIDEFKGTVASQGIAKGRVKIVRKIHDFINFKEGDILVSSMTRPDMVMLMEKASAIVTDEGGITCHAAIVSREMGKPCIIGTNVATKVLKDGDFVEVDANKGTIKILKKAK